MRARNSRLGVAADPSLATGHMSHPCKHSRPSRGFGRAPLATARPRWVRLALPHRQTMRFRGRTQPVYGRWAVALRAEDVHQYLRRVVGLDGRDHEVEGRGRYGEARALAEGLHPPMRPWGHGQPGMRATPLEQIFFTFRTQSGLGWLCVV